jgi:predicted ATPase
MMQDMIAEDAQFIVATHSPILLAFPEARIYSFDSAPAVEVKYEDLEHVRLTKDFLNGPERYLRAMRDARD